jgi:NADPH-dependent 2,4-dienoyl-CoA reductase/sulfur reductase-like enzyme
VSTESYDKLVLSPGAPSVRPPLPGIDLPGIFPVRTVPDAREIREWIERGTSFLAGMEKYSGFQTVRPARHAVVIGGGFIGLEMAENLVGRGFDVTVVEMADQVLAPLDLEYGRLVKDFLERNGVHVALGDGVAGFEQAENDTLAVSTLSGKRYPADLVILALGVRPDTTLARMAGLEIGEHGGIRVDELMRTSNPDIFAVGDAVEVRDFVTGEWSLMALAGPANRQARIAADVIAGRDSRFRGTQGTAVVELFGSAVAWTGANEKTLERLGDDDFEKIYLYPNSHAGYYPGAKPIAMKVLFRKSDGRVIGAQAVGEDGVDKRISELALAIQLGATVYDLEECELCYSSYQVNSISNSVSSSSTSNSIFRLTSFGTFATNLAVPRSRMMSLPEASSSAMA